MKKPKKVLFVCIANKNRSPAAEEVFIELLKQKGYRIFGLEYPLDYDYVVSSAGIKPYEYGTQLEKETADSADSIITFEKELEDILINEYKQNKEKIINLKIPDNYDFNEPALRKLLKSKLKSYLD